MEEDKCLINVSLVNERLALKSDETFLSSYKFSPYEVDAFSKLSNLNDTVFD
jgi:hypothetical protein